MWLSELVVVLVSICITVHTQDLRVFVRQGSLQGTKLSSLGGRDIFAFYNIPYAKPPIGQYRFMEPQPPDPWSGERDATTPGKACLQHITQSFLTTGVEDCLYLNVFTPILPNISAIPPWFSVIVFFHNQVFITGNSNLFGPTYLLDQDVILVTVNFRLGVLGFLSTEDAVVPGNNGLKDQVAALSWVRDNIKAFGGDEDRVTIAGNTAGAVSVHFHYLSPLSRGLFNQGIVQSGSATVPWAIAENLLSKTQFIAATLNCSTSDSQLMIDCLRTFPPQQLILFTQNYEVFLNTPFAPFGPCVERTGERPFLPEYPYRLLQRGCGLDRPIIFSNCEYEGLYPLAAILNNDELLDFLDRRWVDIAPYLLNFNETVPEIWKRAVSLIIKHRFIGDSITAVSAFNVVKLFGDRQFTADIGRAAALQARLNLLSPVYFYQFRYRGQNSYSEFYNPTNFKNYGAANGDDLLYILDNALSFFNSSSDLRDAAMRDLMVKLWASFAINGVPDVGNITWDPVLPSDFRKGSLTYLEIAGPDELRMMRRQNYGNFTFWNSLPFVEPESGRESCSSNPSRCAEFFKKLNRKDTH